MSRRHEKFTYSYGIRTAPEQWHFGWNGKPIRLDSETRSEVAALMLAGEEEKAAAVLKRLLRKQEKEESYICIGFWSSDGREYYFTQDLRCKRNDLKEKLYSYKEWKRYIKERSCRLSTHSVQTGYLAPDGKMTGEQEEYLGEEISLKRPCIVRLVKPMEDRVFQF